MMPNQSRTSGAIVLVSSLAVVLVTLAVLQYRWSGQISQAERDRLQAGLRTAVSQFHDQFLSTLQRLCSNLQMNPALIEKQDWQRYARDCRGSLGGSSGRLVEDVYLWLAADSPESQLLRLNREMDSFQPVPWPARLERVRSRFGQAFAGEPASFANIRPLSWTVVSDIPLLIQPLMEFPKPPGSEPRGFPILRQIANMKLVGYVLAQLNMDAIRGELLPELAQRYFATPDGFVYQIAVVAGRDQEHEPIYESEPNVAASVFSKPDARVSLLEPPGLFGPGEPGRERFFEFRPRGTAPPPPNLLGFGSSPLVRPGKARGAMLFVHDGADWELVARHHLGPLETVVAGSRRRNLAISFGILLLLACSMALVLANAQKTRRLAELQMDFVAGVSHELKTPLAVICSAGDNLAEGVIADSSGVTKYGDLIRSEGVKLTRIVEQILQFARFQNGRNLQNCAPLDINESVDATLERTLPALTAAGFQVEKSLATDLPRVKADAAVLAQCIQSLLDNAMKYSGENRRLALRTGVASGRQGAEALITVEDKGIGINAADLPYIFTPFYRGQTATAAQIRGTGLGLSIANDSVAAMGGEISVTSAVGEGSSFTIHLPALPDNDQQE